MPKTKSTSRLQFLDWARGFGAVIMLQGHTFHSLLRQDLRTSSTFVLSDFLGGMPSAIFLFLTGVTLAFLMDSRERQGVKTSQRVIASFSAQGTFWDLRFWCGCNSGCLVCREPPGPICCASMCSIAWDWL